MPLHSASESSLPLGNSFATSGGRTTCLHDRSFHTAVSIWYSLAPSHHFRTHRSILRTCIRRRRRSTFRSIGWAAWFFVSFEEALVCVLELLLPPRVVGFAVVSSPPIAACLRCCRRAREGVVLATRPLERWIYSHVLRGTKGEGRNEYSLGGRDRMGTRDGPRHPRKGREHRSRKACKCRRGSYMTGVSSAR